MDRQRWYHGLSLVAGTLISFVLGLAVPSLVGLDPGALVSGSREQIALRIGVLFVLGIGAGAFGRGLVGLVALWVGFVLDQAGRAGPAGIPGDALGQLALALVIGGVGYAIARAVDPFWGSEPVSRPSPTPAPRKASDEKASDEEDAEPFRVH